MNPVTSSNIKAVGYDPAQKLLAVQFANGGTYHYHAIEPHQHAALMAAPSVGKHLSTHIKPTCKRVVKA